MRKEKSNGLDLNTILQVASIIGLIIFLSKILGKSGADEKKDEADASRKKGYDKIPPSYEDFQYADFADELEQYLLRDATEDEEGVYSVFRELKNISDVNKTIEFFAERRAGYTLDWVTLPRAMNLLSQDEKFQVNAILAKKGISYRFK